MDINLNIITSYVYNVLLIENEHVSPSTNGIIVEIRF